MSKGESTRSVLCTVTVMRRTSMISPNTASAGGVATARGVARPPVIGVLAELPHPAHTAAAAASQVATFRRLTLSSAGMPIGGWRGLILASVRVGQWRTSVRRSRVQVD
jgi:hypothetical protein